MTKGKLYIVATPIGNMGDITVRALDVLKAAEMIAAEDTRRTVKLLNHFGIKGKMVSFHEHSSEARRKEIVAHMMEGRAVALVSDAGTPVISDPGLMLVRDCIAADIPIESIPGANAAVVAVTLSGIDCSNFIFAGFLPQKGAARKKKLDALAAAHMPVVFYESPGRVTALLEGVAEAFGPGTPVCVSRELTKMYEETLRGSAEAICAQLAEREAVKGEFVVVAGVPEQAGDEATDEMIVEQLEKCIAAGHTKKEAVTLVTADLSCSKNRVYKIMIHMD